jgi:hypothetical protein
MKKHALPAYKKAQKDLVVSSKCCICNDAFVPQDNVFPCQGGACGHLICDSCFDGTSSSQ